jgi:hypothetical protein
LPLIASPVIVVALPGCPPWQRLASGFMPHPAQGW